MSADENGNFLFDGSVSNEDKARRIAEVLRRGQPSKLFLAGLAMMFSPVDPRQQPQYRVVITGPEKGGRPRRKQIDIAGEHIADLVKRDGWKVEAATQDAMEKFSMSRRTAMSAYRQELRERALIKKLAEAGETDFEKLVQEWW